MEAPREPSGGEVALSAAEEAYLRRFVRRHALSGLRGRSVAAAALAALGLALWLARPSEPPGPAPGVATFDAEIAALRKDLAARSAPTPPDAATLASVAELSRRIEAIAREIAALRARAESAPVPARAPAPPSLPSGADHAALAERLYNVELRQTQAEASGAKTDKELLARLQGLEIRQEEREREDASALRSALERVERLEASRDVAEARRLEGQNAILARLDAVESRLETAPAAAQP